jgi:hypothetical protein
VIEAIRRNPNKYNSLPYHDMSTTTMPAQHSSPPLHIEGYRDMIVDEAKRLNDRLLKYFKIVLWIMLLSG